MPDATKTIKSRGTVTIDVEDCKGCDLCIPACPPGVLAMSTAVNHIGLPLPRAARRAAPAAPRACYVCPDFVFEVFRFDEPRADGGRRHDRDRDRTLDRDADGGLGGDGGRVAIAAGCRFFAGYPMTPFTEVLEHFAKRAARRGRRVHQRRVELEAVGMAWGALATGARAATGSTGQGLSLMQESFSEITLAELPLVIFNMARGQQDYYQATRGGGHGDYRHIVLAPQDVGEARRARAARVPPRRQVAQPGARLRRLPARAHAGGGRRSSRSTFPELPAEGLGGRRVARRQRRSSRIISPLGFGKAGQRARGQEGNAQYIATKLAADGSARCGSRPASSTTRRR